MIPILYAGNCRMFDGLLISAVSAAVHSTQPLDITLLTMDLREVSPDYLPLTENQRQYLERLCDRRCPGSRVTLIDVGDLYRAALADSPNTETGYTPYCFLRLFADRLPLPDKLLYLDADTVIAGDLLPLFQTDVSGVEYAAVLDHYGRFFMGYHYINSGVMLLNLKRIRETGLFRRAVALCAEKRLFLPDQTALHRLTQDKLLLPVRYNEQKHYDRADTVIQHFCKTILWLPVFHTRTVKPWEPQRVHDLLTDRYDAVLSEYLCHKKLYEEEYPDECYA